MIKKLYIAVVLALGLLTLTPALSLAQTQPAAGNQVYGFTGTQGRMMPGFQATDGQGQITFQSPMMSQYGYKAFGSYPYHNFNAMGMIVCGITLLMLWVLMALGIITLAVHLKKTLHKKE